MMPHASSLLRFARRLTRDVHAAEDLAQETLLRAWRAFNQFRDGTNERAWLFRILINEMHTRARKKGALAETGFVVDRGESSRVLEGLEVRQAVGELPLEYRAALLLTVIEGFTCEEAAGILSVPIGTVMSRLSRARQALRAKLAPSLQSLRRC